MCIVQFNEAIKNLDSLLDCQKDTVTEIAGEHFGYKELTDGLAYEIVDAVFRKLLNISLDDLTTIERVELDNIIKEFK